MQLHKLALSLVFFAAPLPVHADSWKMRVAAEHWQLIGFEQAFDLSGIASADGKHCLVGSDELFYVQPGTMDAVNHRIHAGPPVPLIPLDQADDKTEVDIEGIAWSPRDSCYYVTGSHGLSKKKASFEEARNTLYRIRFEPQDGQVRADAIRSSSLTPVLEKFPEIVSFLRLPLQQNGVNIEGLTVSDGHLFFGLRAPNLEGRGLVIEIDPRALFDHRDDEAKLHEVELGEGRGIREIAAVHDGFVIVTGNASAEASKKFPESEAPGPDQHFELLHWNPADGSKVSHLGDLPRNGGKAEGLLVLEDQSDRIRMMVLFDSLENGAPLVFELTRP